MSRVFKSYLAGLLKGLPDLLPFFAPTVNSYKRLVDGYWAPTKVTWGIDNRTVAFRVIPGGAKSTRVEVRVSGSDINPYLALAASIGAGLWGVDQELPLEDAPVVGSAYRRKASACRAPAGGDARLSESKLAREILGEEFVDHYVHPRVGVAAVPGRGHGLGAAPILRDDLSDASRRPPWARGPSRSCRPSVSRPSSTSVPACARTWART